MTEEAESGPIQASNLIKEAWIKLATDKDVIHALRTLSNEEVRNALLTDSEWNEFVALVSGNVEEGVRSEPSNGSVNAAHLIQTSFLVHLSVWFVFVSLALSAWIWWFGMKRGWWGRAECYRCSYPVEKRMSRCSPERISNVNFSKEIGSLRESTFGEKCDCPACCGSQLNSHSVEDCASTAYHVSQHSQTSQNVPLAQPEDPLDCLIPQDPILYPARIITESEKPKIQAQRKSSQTKPKRSSQSKSSKKPQSSTRSKRQSLKTRNELDTSGSSLVERENNTKQVIVPSSYNQGTSKYRQFKRENVRKWADPDIRDLPFVR